MNDQILRSHAQELLNQLRFAFTPLGPPSKTLVTYQELTTIREHLKCAIDYSYALLDTLDDELEPARSGAS